MTIRRRPRKTAETREGGRYKPKKLFGMKPLTFRRQVGHPKKRKGGTTTGKLARTINQTAKGDIGYAGSIGKKAGKSVATRTYRAGEKVVRSQIPRVKRIIRKLGSTPNNQY